MSISKWQTTYFLLCVQKYKKVVHNEPIHRPDLQNLYTLFNWEEADRVQNKVFVDEMLYFCNGEGLDNWRLATLPLARILKADDLCVWQGIMRRKTKEMTKTIVKEG